MGNPSTIMTNDRSRVTNANRQHPFESSPLLGTRPPTKSWGQLVQTLDNDTEHLDGASDAAVSEDGQQDTTAMKASATPKRHGQFFRLVQLTCCGLSLFKLADHPARTQSISAVVKQRSRYYVPVSTSASTYGRTR